MFLRDVLKRWQTRPIDTTAADDGGRCACRATSLLEELAADPADFADLGARPAPRSPRRRDGARHGGRHHAGSTGRASRGAARRGGGLAPRPGALRRNRGSSRGRGCDHAAATSTQLEASGGGGGLGRRWARARGGARAHREAAEQEPRTAARPALVQP